MGRFTVPIKSFQMLQYVPRATFYVKSSKHDYKNILTVFSVRRILNSVMR